MAGEFELIERYFAPLAGPDGLGLKDDAAVVEPPAGQSLVVTADALIAGVHFLDSDPPDLVARKALRVNLSDLAAMGAKPYGYVLTIAWPGQPEGPWVAAFAAGLAEDQERYGISLLGGDTTSGPGPLCLSISAFGFLRADRALRRSGAGEGDLVYVSGTLGDAALGLVLHKGALTGLDQASHDHLVSRYLLPQPRLDLGRALADGSLASAAIDISDGLAADLGHVAEASGLAAVVEAPRLPLSPQARTAVALYEDLVPKIVSGGDDYELLFTVPPNREDEVQNLSRRLGLPLTRIGRLERGRGLVLSDADGRQRPLEPHGWQHF